MKVVLKLIRTFFLRWVKILPTPVGGPLLWGWIYGAPRLPLWGVTLSSQKTFSSLGSSRRVTPQFSSFSRAVPRVYPLEDEEWFSLDTVFPVEGVEPFQELGLDYFMQQQDDNLETQQDSPTEEDYLYGTNSGEYSDEDNPGINDIDLFYKLETRENTYSRDDHPGPDEVEIFTPLARRRRGVSFKKWGLGRMSTPGEGPTSFNREDNPLGYDGYYPQWTGWADWYLWRVSPTRITADFNWPETFYYYLLFENRHTWGGDPTSEDPAQWARNARGWPVWLFRRNSRLWGPGRWRVHKEWVKRRRYNWWSKPWIKTYKKLPNGFHRRYKRFRYWYRLRELEFNPRSNRWGAPFSGRTPNPMVEPDEWGYFQNTRFLESSFFYRRKRLRQRYQRLNQGVRQKWRPARGCRPRFGWARRRGFFNPRWWNTPRVGRSRPFRARIAPWVAPRWGPAGVRVPAELPPTGVVPGLLLVGGWLACWLVWENRYLPWELITFPLFSDTPVREGWLYPPDEFSLTRGWTWWQKYSVSGFFGGDYFRKSSLGLPNEWELLRGGAPRERHSTRTFGDGAYSLTWGGKWHYLSPVGHRWWSHPDIGGNLLGLHFRAATFDTYNLFGIIIGDDLWYSQNMFGWNGADVANLLERQIYFPYIDIHIPSWAHAHDVIGDSWVVYRGFRTWVDGGQELTTVRRIIDHRYNRMFDITHWLYKIFYKRFWPVFSSFITYRGDVLPQYEEIQRFFFLSPTWVPVPSPASQEGVSHWEIAYLDGWERVTSTQLWSSPRALRRQSMGLDVLDQVTSLDSRPRSRSEGFVYLGLPTSWEAHLNFKLLQKWSTSPWLEDPGVPLTWFDSRVALFLSHVGPWCTYLFWTFLIPAATLSFYGAAFFSWGPTFQTTLTGSQVTPQERYHPAQSEQAFSSTVAGHPGRGAYGLALTREGRHLRRGSRFPARGEASRTWRASPTWRWSPEEYWAQHRLGFSRQFPTLRGGLHHRGGRHFFSRGRRRQVSNLGINSSFSSPSPGGGLGYSLTRFSSRSRREEIFCSRSEREQTKEGVTFFPLIVHPEKSSFHGGWLWRGWFSSFSSEATPPQEKAYPPRGRRRRPRGDDRLLTPHGTWSPHRRGDPPRGDYSPEVYTPHPGSPVEGFVGNSFPRNPTFWRLPPGWFTRSLHSQWHLNRYRSSLEGGAQPSHFSSLAPAGVTLKGLTQLGELNFPGASFVHRSGKVLSPGYNTEFYSDEYFDLVEDGHQVDDGYEEHNFDTLGEDYLGFRYLGGWTSPVVGKSLPLGEGLLSYHRGQTLPARVYTTFPTGGAGNPAWGGPLWGSLGVDHPQARNSLWGGYEIPRFYRRVYRQEEQERTTLLEQNRLRRRRGPRSFKIEKTFSVSSKVVVSRKKRTSQRKIFSRRLGWATPFSLLSSGSALQDQLYRLGWSTAEGQLTFSLDDQDCLEFGFSSLHGGGYTLGGPAGLSHLQGRPYHRMARVWSPPRGLNGWRYLVGEDLTQLNRAEGETVFLERLTTAYTDNYEEDAEAELGIVFDRDPEDEYFDAQNFEELDAEIPRPRVVDYPAWLLEEALGGASPGVIQPEGIYSRFGEANFAVPDGGHPGWRNSRRELRRHYRRARIKVSRWRRQQNPIRFPRGADLVNQHLRDVSPGGPDEQSLTPAEIETFTGVVSDDLEAEEEDELELRLWALTEIYYGDYPTGTFLDS